MSLKSYSGRVVKVRWASGSKSDHMAVCLVDRGGKSLRLRRVGGNPFLDTQLEKLVGKEIEGEGELIAGSTLLLSRWSELKGG